MKITPKTKPDNTVNFTTLKSGDLFIHQGGIWVKIAGGDQDGVNLNTGEYQSNMCGDVVTPVEATLTWKRKKVTAKKK
ncbi:MAG TPA: hypothetical protein ENH82_06915 [bacterium]|nr:hypothetical protein [bacterium]